MAPSPESLVARARRLGPLPYSSLGSQPPAAADAGPPADWEVDLADYWWEQAGRPDPYTLVEVGAGDGTRARRVLELGPRCLSALRLVLVEPGCEESHRAVLPLEEPAFLFPAGSADPDDPDSGPLPAVGIGPLVTSVPDLPVLDGVATVVMFGWLGRMPADRFEWRDGRWWEVRLAAEEGEAAAPAGAGGGTAGDGEAPELPSGLAEMLVPVDGLPIAVDWPPVEGQRVARLAGAVYYLGEALRTAPAGVVAVVEHWSATTGPMAGGPAPEVALDQLAVVRAPIDPAPIPLDAEWSVVTWRLG